MEISHPSIIIDNAEMKDIKNSIYKSLQLIGISFTKQYVNDFLKNHSDSTSMLCLSDLFDLYKVETSAGEFEDKNELINYPGAHISQLVYEGKSYFVVVEYIKENTITYYNHGKRVMESLEEYFKKWKGVVLFFSKKPHSAEPNYELHRKEEQLTIIKRILFALAALSVMVALVFASIPILLPATFALLLLLKLCGIIASVFLLSYTYNTGNNFVNSICKIGKKGNCNTILNSKAAKVFSFLSWSEIGLFYFTSTFLTLIIIEIFDFKAGYYLLTIINLLALPYTLYSVYYQKVIAKSWCVLCLSVQVLLWVEFLAHLSLWNSFSFQNFFVPAITIMTSGLFVITTWYLIKPLLEAGANLKIAKKYLTKFKKDLSLFHYILNNQPKFSYPKQADVFRFGSQTPKIHFTIFTNPVCAYCNKVHLSINKLLAAYPLDIALTEIFSVSSDDRDERKQIAAHMIQLKKNQSGKYVQQALQEWHSNENKKSQEWIGKYPAIGNALKENAEILKLHISISNSLSITHTPTVCINGKLLPDLYRVEDLEKIIPEWLASLENSN